MPPLYQCSAVDGQDTRRFSSQFTLNNSQEFTNIHFSNSSPQEPSKAIGSDLSQYTSFDDDMHRRFYATRRQHPDLAQRRSESRSWPKDEDVTGLLKDENICRCRTSLAEQAFVPTTSPPVSFFSRAIAQKRTDVLVHYFKTLGILWVFALAVLSLYWAVLTNVNQNLEALKIAVVSFDGHFAPFETSEPIVGNALIRAVERANTLPNHLGWTVMTPAQFQTDPLEVRRWVSHLDGWGAIIVNNNATALLRRAVETGDPNHDPLGAGEIIYEQARDLETITQYVAPVLIDIGKQVVADFGSSWTQQVLRNDSLSRMVFSSCPQALSPAIGFSIFNLRPFDPPAAIPSVTIGLIYLIIIAYFSFGFFLPIHMEFVVRTPTDSTPQLKFRHLVSWRWASTVFAYLCLSLAYSLVSRMFRVPFTTPSAANDIDVFRNPTPYGVHTFAVYWMVNFVGMVALGLACENVGMVIGTPWVGLWLIFWVISNVATGFYALELAPTFFRWGYIWPLHSIVEASRTVLFDTRHMLGRDFGILLGWAAVDSALFPFCCKFMRWKATRTKQLAAVAAAAATSTAASPKGGSTV